MIVWHVRDGDTIDEWHPSKPEALRSLGEHRRDRALAGKTLELVRVKLPEGWSPKQLVVQCLRGEGFAQEWDRVASFEVAELEE